MATSANVALNSGALIGLAEHRAIAAEFRVCVVYVIGICFGSLISIGGGINWFIRLSPIVFERTSMINHANGYLYGQAAIEPISRADVTNPRLDAPESSTR